MVDINIIIILSLIDKKTSLQLVDKEEEEEEWVNINIDMEDNISIGYD